MRRRSRSTTCSIVSDCSCGGKSGIEGHHTSKANGYIHRRRFCIECGRRWSTKEIPAEEYDTLLDLRISITAMQSKLNELLGRLPAPPGADDE